jgi:hypothetical protein
MSDESFTTPGRKIPPRQPVPGEKLFEFLCAMNCWSSPGHGVVSSRTIRSCAADRLGAFTWSRDVHAARGRQTMGAAWREHARGAVQRAVVPRGMASPTTNSKVYRRVRGRFAKVARVDFSLGQGGHRSVTGCLSPLCSGLSSC